MSYKFDYLVYIGRMQPFHNGHLHIVKKALEISEKVIIVLGSANSARSPRNPFTIKERTRMIVDSIPDELISRVSIVPQSDHTYNEDRWIASIQATVFSVAHLTWRADPTKIGIVGYDKDHSSYYLKKFPQWELVSFEPYMYNGMVLSSTDIREMMYSNMSTYFIKELIPSTKYLESFMDREEFLHLVDEHNFIKRYKYQWKDTPYPVTFVTVDAVVVQSGHVLLVERGAAPGEGLWALPGGFINQNETLLEATLRELKEETKLAVPIPVLVGSIDKSRVYDNPHRSERGRTITHATYFRLNDQETLPKIKGSDDARKAFWLPFSDVMKNQHMFFEDHFHMISNMIGI